MMFTYLLAVAVCLCGAVNYDLDWDVTVGDQGTTTINKGDTVTWTWTDGNAHSVTSTDGKFTSSAVETGAGTNYSVTLNNGGSYPYDCSVHASMQGVIEVTGTRFDLDWDVDVGDQGTTKIDAGDVVVWTWTDGNPHSVRSTNGKFTSSSVLTGAGNTYTVTFTDAGAYPYDCSVHPSMQGDVKAGGSGSGGNTAATIHYSSAAMLITMSMVLFWIM